MFTYFDTAIRLLASRKTLFLAIVFSVSLPIHILTALVSDRLPDDSLGSVYISLLLDSVFAPICIGSFVFAFIRLRRNDPIPFAQAMRAGLNCWPRLFAARLLASLYIVLGLICLIVPGIILSLRYAFVDAVVVLEGLSPAAALKRSKELTQNFRGRIFAAIVIFLIGSFVLAMAFSSLLNILELSGPLLDNILFDCLFDLTLAILTAVILLLYQKAQPAPPSRLGC